MELNQYIEHTLLKQNATKEELIKLFDEAKKYNFKGVCVNGCNTALAKEHLKKYLKSLLGKSSFLQDLCNK